MKFHPDVLAAHAQFGGDLESMQKCYDWCDLTKEVSRLKIEASKHAHDAETVRRQRDQFMRENQSFTDAVVTLWEALSKACEIMSAYKRAGHGDEVHMDTLCCAIRTAEDALLQTAVQKQRCPAPNPRLIDAAKRVVETYAKMEDGNGDPCPDIAALRTALDGTAPETQKFPADEPYWQLDKALTGYETFFDGSLEVHLRFVSIEELLFFTDALSYKTVVVGPPNNLRSEDRK